MQLTVIKTQIVKEKKNSFFNQLMMLWKVCRKGFSFRFVDLVVKFVVVDFFLCFVFIVFGFVVAYNLVGTVFLEANNELLIQVEILGINYEECLIIDFADIF